MKSELHGLYNEVQEDANCSDPPAQESAKKRPGGKEEPTLLLHPRPRPDRREICEKSSQGRRSVPYALRCCETLCSLNVFGM